MKILADASLPNLEILFPRPFILKKYNNINNQGEIIKLGDILICRSTLKIDKNLLLNTNIKCVASATSGVCHIDENYLLEKNIKLFDAKGANSTSVKDYVIATLALLKLKGKIKGDKVGIIGLGHIGEKVKQQLQQLKFRIISYDPYKFTNTTMDDLIQSDIICVHANLHEHPPYPSKNLLNDLFLKKLKKNTIIINTARGGIVNEQDLLSCKSLIYCTDVYSNEPHINKNIINFSETCTPHIAGHSVEGKQNTVKLISQKIHKYYNLLPPLASFYSDTILQLPISSWSEQVLRLYNPEKETMLLKKSADISQTFKDLRKLHQNRHDFLFAKKDLGEICQNM